MKTNNVCIIAISLLIISCGSAPKKVVPKRENYLTLADLNGKVRLKENSPNERVIRVRAKSLIKNNDIRSAKNKALGHAQSQALDAMVRELVQKDIYNNNYEKIEKYIGQSLQNYIFSSEVNDEKKIFNGEYYGIDSAHKVNRQKVLVALQKDLKLINTSSSTLVTVITSKKGIDLSSSGFTFSDLEDALMNQIQTDLNQRGLRAMDFRNAVTSMQTDTKLKEQFAKISKDQFMAIVSGSSAGTALLDKQIQNAEEFYTTGLSLLKQLAKVVIEVNIFAIQGDTKSDLALSMMVTAKNISTSRGGAFANYTFTVARRGNPNTIASAMITGLVQDAFSEMKDKFLPQVIKEMSTIAIEKGKLQPYEIVLRDFKSQQVRKIRRVLDQKQNDEFRYTGYDNSLPGTVLIFVRYSEDQSRLADFVMEELDSMGIGFEDPIIAPDLTDVFFKYQAEDPSA